LLLEERVREQVLERYAPVPLAMERGGLSRTWSEFAEEGLIIGEAIGRGAKVALLALLLVLLLEPVHLQRRDRERVATSFGQWTSSCFFAAIDSRHRARNLHGGN